MPSSAAGGRVVRLFPLPGIGAVACLTAPTDYLYGRADRLSVWQLGRETTAGGKAGILGMAPDAVFDSDAPKRLLNRTTAVKDMVECGGT